MPLAAEGTLAREELIEYLRGLFRTLPPESPLWNICIYAADVIYPEELLPEIRAAYDADLVDRTWISMNDIERTMGEGRDATLAQLRRSHHYVTDAIRMLENWACFRGEDDNDAYAPIEDNWYFPQMPYVLEPPKDRSQRSIPVRQRKEIQEMLYARVAAAALHPGYGCFLPKNITHQPSMLPPSDKTLTSTFRSWQAPMRGWIRTATGRSPYFQYLLKVGGICLRKMSAGAEKSRACR